MKLPRVPQAPGLPRIPEMLQPPKINAGKAPKLRSPVYKPTWKQIGKGKFPAIKVKSDTF